MSWAIRVALPLGWTPSLEVIVHHGEVSHLVDDTLRRL